MSTSQTYVSNATRKSSLVSYACRINLNECWFHFPSLSFQRRPYCFVLATTQTRLVISKLSKPALPAVIDLTRSTEASAASMIRVPYSSSGLSPLSPINIWLNVCPQRNIFGRCLHLYRVLRPCVYYLWLYMRPVEEKWNKFSPNLWSFLALLLVVNGVRLVYNSSTREEPSHTLWTIHFTFQPLFKKTWIFCIVRSPCDLSMQ